MRRVFLPQTYTLGDHKRRRYQTQIPARMIGSKANVDDAAPRCRRGTAITSRCNLRSVVRLEEQFDISKAQMEAFPQQEIYPRHRAETNAEGRRLHPRASRQAPQA
jgi:hypothetical protein